jgi:hypothetical protein
MSKKILIPVKKILKTINSCQNEHEIKECEILVKEYLKSARKNGVINIDELDDRLDEELLQRQEAIYLSYIIK